MADGRGDWVFGLAENGEWEWRHGNRDTAGTVKRSSATFRAFLECMADAQQHGYVPLAAMSSSRIARRRTARVLQTPSRLSLADVPSPF